MKTPRTVTSLCLITALLCLPVAQLHATCSGGSYQATCRKFDRARERAERTLGIKIRAADDEYLLNLNIAYELYKAKRKEILAVYKADLGDCLRSGIGFGVCVNTATQRRNAALLKAYEDYDIEERRLSGVRKLKKRDADNTFQWVDLPAACDNNDPCYCHDKGGKSCASWQRHCTG